MKISSGAATTAAPVLNYGRPRLAVSANGDFVVIYRQTDDRPAIDTVNLVATTYAAASATFGQVVGLEVLSTMEDTKGRWVWIPPGFAHGVYFSGDGAIEYACTSAWSRGCEVTLDPQDPDLDWSPCDPGIRDEIIGALSGDAIRNEKDQAGLSVADWLADPNSD